MGRELQMLHQRHSCSRLAATHLPGPARHPVFRKPAGRRSGALQKKKAGCPISAAAETEPRTQPQSASYAWRSEPGASVAGEEGQFLSSSSPAPPQRAPHQSSDASLQSARQQWQANAAGQISREAAQTGQQQLHNAPITAHAAPSRQVTPQHSVQQPASSALRSARPALIGGAVFLGGTLLIAVIRLIRKNTTPEARRRRSVNKNQTVVETLKQYLPDNRMGLDKGVVRTIRRSTGFSPEDIFRKYLWYLLRERVFDQSAIEDSVLLKGTLGLSDSQVAEALRERAQRIYDRYGNVMLEVKGMTKAGVDRKATCRQLFSKLLYLSEDEQLIAQDGPAATLADIPGVFGATEDDTNKLRIISLTEVDFDVLESQFLPDDNNRPPGFQS